MNAPPFDFSQAAQINNPEGYPYSISAKDLMQNFVASHAIINSSTPIGSENLLKSAGITGMGGHSTRELYVESPIPVPPKEAGVYVLGCNYGRIQWIATEKC